MQSDHSFYNTFYLPLAISAFFIFMILLLIGCTARQNEKPNLAQVDTITKTQPVVVKKETITDATTVPEEVEQNDDDCVFNNDYKELTTGWLKELNKTNFIWRAHFGFIVELKLAHDNHLLSDSVYWVHKSLDLTTEYKMDHYSKTIQSGKIKAVQQGETTVWYEVDDDRPDDNLFYTGIEIRVEGTSKRIRIAQYFN